MKGNSFASVLGLGGQKRGKWGRTFGGAVKKFTFYSTFKTKMDFSGEGPKLFLC